MPTKFGFSIKPKKAPKKQIKSALSAPQTPSSPSNPRIQLKATAKEMHRAKMNCVKALEQDHTVFQYDEIYDQMAEEKKAKEAKKQPKGPQKSKYVEKLKKVVRRKKIEGDIIYEKLQLKEREKTDFLFEDKPILITPAYKKVLEQRKRLKKEIEAEEKLNRENSERGALDVLAFQQSLFAEKIGESSKLSKLPKIAEFSGEIAGKMGKKLEKVEEKRESAKEWKEKFGLLKKTNFSMKKEGYKKERRNSERDVNAARERYLKRKENLDLE